MQQYQDYGYGSYQTETKKKDRTGATLIGALMIFIFLGFLAGLAILAIRNAYLFT